MCSSAIQRSDRFGRQSLRDARFPHIRLHAPLHVHPDAPATGPIGGPLGGARGLRAAG
jgi:hypothetical protein